MGTWVGSAWLLHIKSDTLNLSCAEQRFISGLNVLLPPPQTVIPAIQRSHDVTGLFRGHPFREGVCGAACLFANDQSAGAFAERAEMLCWSALFRYRTIHDTLPGEIVRVRRKPISEVSTGQGAGAVSAKTKGMRNEKVFLYFSAVLSGVFVLGSQGLRS